MDNPLDFSGRVVLVTGGGKGVGKGITEAFLSAGADVVICAADARFAMTETSPASTRS